MKFCLAKEHLDFFSKFEMLEIDSLMTGPQTKEVKLLVDKVLDQRFRNNVVTKMADLQSNFYEIGHDLWRDDESLKKIVFNKRICEIGYELGFPTPYRIGFDQYLTSNIKITETISLEDFSPFQGFLFGYLLCLNQTENIEENSSSPFSNKIGNICFLNSSFLIDFSLLQNQKNSEYLLVTFLSEKSVYTFKDKANQVHSLKKFGYAFGDRIAEKTNPIIYRK